MICDAHVHIGQFREYFFPPQNVLDFLTDAGVERFAVSSTTTCAEDDNRVITEMREIIRLGEDRIVPVLWLTPSMILCERIKRMLDCGIPWRCLKIHGYAQHWSKDEIEQCVTLAQQLHIPLLFHTGGCDESNAGSYLNVCKEHPQQLFILAHARPIEQCIEVMKQCPNVWTDTSFVPMEYVKKLIQLGFYSRILFGTDFPMQRICYQEQDPMELYNAQVQDTKTLMTKKEWESISHSNFENIFPKRSGTEFAGYRNHSSKS